MRSRCAEQQTTSAKIIPARGRGQLSGTGKEDTHPITHWIEKAGLREDCNVRSWTVSRRRGGGDVNRSSSESNIIATCGLRLKDV